MEHIGRSIRLSGRVQGVGYRYFAKKNADLSGVRGFVVNRADGTLYVEAHGEAEDVMSFIELLISGPSFAYVTEHEILRIPYDGSVRTFKIGDRRDGL